VRHRQVVRVWLCGVLLSMSLAGVPAASAQQVIATFSILGDIVAQVAGSTVSVHTLVGPQGDVHTFEPTPADSVSLHKARLVFEIGLGFETWLDKLFTSAQSQARRVVVTAGLLSPARPSTAAHPHAHRDDEGDPHVWFDVQHVLAIVTNVRDAFVQYDPSQAARYHDQAAQYSATLQELDAWILAQVQTLPPRRRKLVTSHDNLGYFARRYGFDVVGAALKARSTDVAEVAARDVAALVKKVKALEVPAIFAETMHNPKLVQRLATEAGVRLAPPLYTDALGPAGSPSSTYVTMMRYNVTTIVMALKP
jgi:zinc/manganese transport system substrate-binding protein